MYCFHPINESLLERKAKINCPSSNACANSADAPYIPSPKGRGFTAHWVKNCPSAQIEVDVSTVLCEINEKNVYQMDYEKLTRNLLAESFSYANAMSKLREIADRNLF